MKELKYNDFKVRFTLNQEDLHKRYDLCIFEGSGDISLSFERSKDILVFYSNERNIYLGNYEKYIIAKKGQKLNLIFTNIKGSPEIYNIRDERSFYDYLILTFCSKNKKVLYVGENPLACIAGWRNAVNFDMFSFEKSCDLNLILDFYLKETQNTYLPF